MDGVDQPDLVEPARAAAFARSKGCEVIEAERVTPNRRSAPEFGMFSCERAAILRGRAALVLRP